VETIFQGPAVESPWDVPLVEHMQRALQREDPEAVIVPYMSTAFTDAKWISRLGIRCYGFSPLLLPDDLDFTALFHGVDERVPVSALHFSVAVLRNLFDEY
jgi:acetylornithine deacetylase/succinyl-diaminopimelate desuccinylase-like protein